MAATDNLGLGTVEGYNSTGANPFLTGANNPYLQANIDAGVNDMTRAYNLTQVPAQNAAALRSGSFGNSGLAELAQQDQNILEKNIGNMTNSARMQDYGNQMQLYMQQQQANNAANQFNLGFGRDIYNDAYSQNMNNLTTGIGLLGTLSNYNQGDLSTATNVQNTPLNYWSTFSNAANGLGQGFGTNTSTQGTTSNPLLTAAGGAQLGNSAAKWWGSQPNSYSSGVSSGAINTANQSSDPIGSLGGSQGWWGTS